MPGRSAHRDVSTPALRRPLGVLRRPRATLAAWAAVVVVLALLGAHVEQRLAAMSLSVPGTPSAAAERILHERFGDSVAIAVLLTGPPRELDQQGPRLVATLRGTGRAQVLSPWEGLGGPGTLRPKPGAALVVASFRGSEQDALTKVVPAAERIVHQTVRPPVRTSLSGVPVVGRALRDAAIAATRRAELLALPVLVLVLLLVFRSPVAAAVPLAMGAATVLAGRGLLWLVTFFTPVNSLGVAIASMMGLALGVDYALLMVSRYRQEREAGAGHEQGVEYAARHAGRTIVFAGGTLAVAMSTAALVAPGGLLGSVAIGVAISGVLSVLLATTAMPALLHVLGASIERWRLPSRHRRRSGLLAASERLVARPAVAIPLVLALTLALGGQAGALALGPPDVRQLPAGDPARRSFEAVERAVGPGWAAPFVVVATARDNVISEPRRLQAVSAWQDRLGRDPDVAAVIGPASLGHARDLQQAQHAYRTAPAQLADAQHGIASLRAGLRDAGAGVAELRAGLRSASAGAAKLGGKAGEAQAGAARLEAGLAQAADGSRRLSDGLDQAARGADHLLAGQRRLRAGADRLARGARSLDDAMRSVLPQLRLVAGRLRALTLWLVSLRAPAQRAAGGLARARAALAAMTVGRGDPRYGALDAALSDATAAIGQPGSVAATSGAGGAAGSQASAAILPLLAGIERQIATAVDTLAVLPDGIDALASSVDRLATGADAVAAGARSSERGTARLRAALRRLSAGSHRLAAGVTGLHDGAGRLERGLGAIAAGAGQLSSGLAAGDRRAAPLALGLQRAQRPLAAYATALHGYQSDYHRLDTVSPGAIDSGYLVLTALDGTVPGVRDQIAQTVNVDGGGQAARMLVVAKSAPSTPATAALSERVRHALPALARTSASDVAVGEGAQSLLDYRDATRARLPWLALALSLVSIAMLVLVLRALPLAVLAVALNLVTITAAFGALELLLRAGLFAGPGYVDAVSATGIFAIMFVLAIDYEVFLLTRMREAWVAHGDHRGAIADGVQRTAGVITGAAAIMSGVFLAFAGSGLSSLSQFGAGLTVAVLIDATIVRLVLLPATMRAIGPRVWWLPRPLERWLPHVEHADPLPAMAAEDAGETQRDSATAEQLEAALHDEHRELHDILLDLLIANEARDGRRVTTLAQTFRDVARPHFRYEDEVLFPAFTELLGVEYVAGLIADHRSVEEALDRIEALARADAIDEPGAAEIGRLAQTALACIVTCHGLGIVVDLQPPGAAERLLAAHAHAHHGVDPQDPGPHAGSVRPTSCVSADAPPSRQAYRNR